MLVTHRHRSRFGEINVVWGQCYDSSRLKSLLGILVLILPIVSSGGHDEEEKKRMNEDVKDGVGFDG